MDKFHLPKEVENVSFELTSDKESENGANGDIFSNNESENNLSNENLAESNCGSESENEETDFWHLLIRNAALDIYNKRKAEGKTGFLPFLTNAEQIAEGEYLRQFLGFLRMKYHYMEQIHDAGCDDPALSRIQNQIKKLKNLFMDETESQVMAWKKYKPMIREKILQNLDDLKILADNSK